MPPTKSSRTPAKRRLPLPLAISPTRAELAARCTRRHLLADFLSLKPVAPSLSVSADWGAQFHAGAAAWWEGLYLLGDPRPQVYERAMDAALADWPIDPELEGYHTQELMRQAMDHYVAHARVQGDAPGHWDVIDIERRIVLSTTLEGDNLLQIPFKLDRVLRSTDDPDVLLVVDTKTSANPGPKWIDSMRQSVQQRVYSMMATQHYGHPEVLSFIEGVGKRTKPPGGLTYLWVSQAWTPEYRAEALGLVLNMAQSDLDIFHAVERMATAQDLDPMDALATYALVSAPFNYMDCNSYYTPCPYQGLCQAMPEEREALLRADYQAVTPWWAAEDMPGLVHGRRAPPAPAAPDTTSNVSVQPEPTPLASDTPPEESDDDHA